MFDPIVRGLTAAWTAYKYHPTQVALLGCRKRFVSVPAGRGSGKTDIALRRLVMALARPKSHGDSPQYFFAGPTVSHAKEVAWNRLLALTPKQWLSGPPLQSKDALMIRTRFGSSLQLLGLHGASIRVEGRQWDGGVIDESCDCPLGVFDRSVLPALTWRNGWCWRIGVPKRFGIGAEEYRDWHEENMTGRHADRAGFWWPSSDILPAESLAYARAHMDERDYDEQFNAQFVTASGGIFHAFDSEYSVRPCAYDPGKPILVAQDFNVDPMAWAFGHCYPSPTRPRDRIEWFDELWMRDTNTQRSLDATVARYGQHGSGFEFYGDASGKARKTSASSSDLQIIANDERLKKLGRTMHYLRGNPPVADRFAATNALICSADGTRRMHVDPRCKRLIHDLQTRPYKPGTREPGDIGDQGHITDAIGYAIYRLFPIRIPVTGSQSVVVVR